MGKKKDDIKRILLRKERDNKKLLIKIPKEIIIEEYQDQEVKWILFRREKDNKKNLIKIPKEKIIEEDEDQGVIDDSRKHWIIYSLGTFISFLVLLEFIISQIFFSQLSPSVFTYHLTPFYLIWGRTSPTVFFSTGLVVLFYLTLSQKVYVLGKNRLTYKSSNAYFLLPFYIIMAASLGYHIIVAPLELSNLLTYVIFLLIAESFYEFSQVADLHNYPKRLRDGVEN